MSEKPHLSMLQKIIHTIDTITEYTGRAISWLTVATALLMATIVTLRYGFNVGWIAMQEGTIYLHAAVFMIGAGYTLKHDEHVRVDIFYRDMSATSKAWVNILGSVFLLLPVCIFIAVASWQYVMSSWGLLEGSSEAGGIEGVFLLKSLILLLVFTLLSQGIAEFLRNVLVITGAAKEER